MSRFVNASGRTPLTDIEDRANDAWLQRQLSRLPSTEYEILHLRQVERKSNGEIAAILGITPQSVTTLLAGPPQALGEDTKRQDEGPDMKRKSTTGGKALGCARRKTDKNGL